MKQLFLDTGVFVADALPQDVHHTDAVKLRETYSKTHHPVTHWGVIFETVTVIRRLSTGDVAARWGRDIRQSGIAVLAAHDDDWSTAMNLISKFGEQKLSAVDAVSFALIRRHNIRIAASFDKHFRIVLPEREIVP